jgi:N-acetylglucosamine kinase
MTLLLGLDGGGSGTLAAVARADGTVKRLCSGKGVDPFGGRGWQDRLAEALAAACDGEMPQAAVLGLPYAGEVQDIERAQDRVASRVLKGVTYRIQNDVEAAFGGAFPGRSGVLLLAGTGSMAWAGDASRMIRIGGHGDAYGDEGSAFWIGREALARTAQILDGRRRGRRFAATMLAATGAGPDGLIAWTYGLAERRAEIAALAPAVCAAATHGDRVARGLIEAAVRHLAAHVRAARRGLRNPGLPWSFAGGVFGCALLLSGLARLIGPPVKPVLPPVGGAVLDAARLAGLPCGPAFVSALAASLKGAAATKDKI